MPIAPTTPSTSSDPNGNFAFIITIGFLAFSSLLGFAAIEIAFHPIKTLLERIGEGWQYLLSQMYKWWTDLVFSKKKPTPLPPGVIGQGKELGNKNRSNENFISRNNYRRPKGRKKHTPGRDHRHHVLWILLAEIWKQMLSDSEDHL